MRPAERASEPGLQSVEACAITPNANVVDIGLARRAKTYPPVDRYDGPNDDLVLPRERLSFQQVRVSSCAHPAIEQTAHVTAEHGGLDPPVDTGTSAPHRRAYKRGPRASGQHLRCRQSTQSPCSPVVSPQPRSAQ
jgi:hypothetical protein